MKEFQIVFEYYLNPEREVLFGTEIHRGMTEFIGHPRPLPPAALSYFADWFLFDFPLASGDPPVSRFPKANPLNVSASDLEPFNELDRNNRFDFFLVKELSKHDMVFESVRDGSRFKVVRAGMRAKEGEVVVCRIGKAHDIWEVLTLDPIAMLPSKNDLHHMKTAFPVFDSKVAYHDIVTVGTRTD